MILVGLGGLVAKLYKPSESNMLFDGGSLVLFMVAVIVYIANIVKGMRIVDTGVYGVGVVPEAVQGLSREEAEAKGVHWGGYDGEDPSRNSVLGREDNLKVLSASNTILALVLLGVLVLQVGQWYADRVDEKSLKEFEEKEREEKAAAATGPSGKEGKREGKKQK
jgi:hypothetical protein